MTVDLSGLIRNITLAVGERLEILLPTYADSGNTWSAICVTGDDVAHVSVELGEAPAVSTPSGDGISEPPGLMLVPERIVVCGLTFGKATWRLVLARSFNTPEPVAAHIFHITVVTAP